MRIWRWTSVAAAVCLTAGCVAGPEPLVSSEGEPSAPGNLVADRLGGGSTTEDRGDVILTSAESPAPPGPGRSEGVPPEVVRMLVDQFTEATPQEREELYQALLRVGPENMGYVLQAWRIGREDGNDLSGEPSVGGAPAPGGSSWGDGSAAPPAPHPSLVVLDEPRPHAAGRPVEDPGPNPFDTSPEFSDPGSRGILPVAGAGNETTRLPLPSDYAGRAQQTPGAGSVMGAEHRPPPFPPDFSEAQASAGPVQISNPVPQADPFGRDGPSVASRSMSPTWRAELERLIASVERELAETPAANAVEQQIYLRMLYMVAGRRQDAAAPIAGLSSSEQEFWQNVLMGFASYLDDDSIPRREDRAAEAAEQLSVALNRLRQSAPLTVSNLAFCRQIQSYGVYEPFPEYAFQAGQQVLLYAEVENFASEPTADGYRTVLHSTLEILDARGQQVWRQEFPQTEDTCRNARRDYFHSYRFDMPPSIYAGHYVLKLRVEDQLAQKAAEATIEFTIE